MNKINITQYSNAELSWIVFNDESLYSIRHELNELLYIIDDLYIYTDAQIDELLSDISDDLFDSI